MKYIFVDESWEDYLFWQKIVNEELDKAVEQYIE